MEENHRHFQLDQQSTDVRQHSYKKKTKNNFILFPLDYKHAYFLDILNKI